jgi:hypothetical protein
MSVYVSDFSTTPWTVIHDEAGHTGTIDPTTIQHPTNTDGTPNPDFLIIVCPVCQSSSTHPVGGGAQPPLVQELFVRHALASGCPCDADMAAGLPPELIAGHIKQHCESIDGAGRWQVTA